VSVINKLASELEVGVDLKERAELCVFELFDSQLLGESILPILRDAHARLLRPGAIMVPRSVRIWALLVECDGLAAGDLPELRGAAWPLMLSQFDTTAMRVLSSPWEATAIDFAVLPPATPSARVSDVHVTETGTAHAIAWWWDLDMGGGGSLSSWTPRTAPHDGVAARHHWRPCLSFLVPKPVRSGGCVVVAAVHDDEAVWFAWHEPSVAVPPRWVEGSVGIPPERERLLIAASGAWIRGMRDAAGSAARAVATAKERGKVVLLPAEDALLLPEMAAAVLSTNADCSLTAVVPPRTGKRLCEAGRLPACVQLVAPAAAQDMASTSAFQAIVVEPFTLGDTTPWALALGCRRRLAAWRSAGAICTSPTTVVLQIVAIECRSAWLARQPLGQACGLDLTLANPELVPSRATPLECHLCELAWRPMSAPAEALRLELASSGPWHGSCQLAPAARGECHGVAFWADFLLGGAGVVSTGPPEPGQAPTGWSQALQLLPAPIHVEPGGDTICLDVQLSTSGEMEVKVMASAKKRR